MFCDEIGLEKLKHLIKMAMKTQRLLRLEVAEDIYIYIHTSVPMATFLHHEMVGTYHLQTMQEHHT